MKSSLVGCLLASLLILAATHETIVSDEIVPHKRYAIRNGLDPHHALTIDSTGQITIRDYIGSPRQHWHFVPAYKGGPIYYLLSSKSPKVLDSMGSPPNFQCSARDFYAERTQRWKISSHTLNRGYVLYAADGKVLTSLCGAENTRVTTQAYINLIGQSWYIQEVDSTPIPDLTKAPQCSGTHSQ